MVRNQAGAMFTMSINNEKLKCKEIREYNQMDNKGKPFSNYAIDIYEKSLEPETPTSKQSKSFNRRRKN